MGKAYKLQCRQCGTEFLHSGDNGYGVMVACVGCGDREESQGVIKCPGCQRRINVSSEDFRSQVIEETIWE